MKLKVLFDGAQTMFLDKVSKFEIEADEVKLPEFIQKKIEENEDQPVGESGSEI